MTNLRFTLLLAVLFAAVSAASAQGVTISTKDEIKASVEAVPCDQDARLEGVKKLFIAAGAKPEDIKVEEFKKGKVSNLVVMKKGTTDETIIVGAHYDRTDDGCGVVDNWTGIVVLANIYRSMAPSTTKKTYKFVAFDAEEKGLVGSEQMVKAMTEDERNNTCSMVNLDSFGQALPMALRSVASSKLLKLAREVGKENDMNFVDVEIEGASADSRSFIKKKIPAITFSGLGRGWRHVLHTSGDNVSAVNMDSVYIGYRFSLIFLAKLDQAECAEYM